MWRVSLDLGVCRACVFSMCVLGPWLEDRTVRLAVDVVRVSSRATLSFYGQTQPRNIWIHKLRRVTGSEITKVTALTTLKVGRNWSTKPATTRAASLP